MQLDIFDHSRDVILRNELIEALTRADVAAALAASRAFGSEYPQDWALAPALVLIEALTAEVEAQALTTLSQSLAWRARLAQRVGPAARSLLGEGPAHAWLAGRWRHLAQCAAGLPWSAAEAEGHAAALWLQAGAWQEAAAAVQRIASWRRMPAPLAWMAEALWRSQGLDAAWPLLVELAWLAPARFEALVQGQADRMLARLLQRFEAAFDAGAEAWAWFPAWALTEQPLLAEPLGMAQPGRQDAPERGFRLMQSLLRLERQGRHHELIEHRRQLRELSETLFRCYMKTR